LVRIADGTAKPGRGRGVVKTKRFAFEPMLKRDAIGELERLGYALFVFVNARNLSLNVLSRRRNDFRGLIGRVVAGEYTPRRAHVAGTPE
jgi:hypothetical protein